MVDQSGYCTLIFLGMKVDAFDRIFVSIPTVLAIGYFALKLSSYNELSDYCRLRLSIDTLSSINSGEK